MSFLPWLPAVVVAVLIASLRPAVVSAQTLTAQITYPPAGATAADLSQPIQWTSVADVQAYYLYVGTTPGAKDLINTGEIHQTWYPAASLPANQLLYARMWTKAAGGWYYADSVFTAAPLTATIVYPANNAAGANLSQPVQWTGVPNAQAYYLYVGTTPGAKDLVNSGETLQTSWVAASVPANQTVYARIWTKVAGVWRYTDSTFSAAPLKATLTYPPNAAVNADLTQPIQWTTVPNIQAYYLYVGTTPGAKDLVNTGEISATSYLASGLPAGQTLYTRIWAKVGGVWRYSDSTFTAAAQRATITYPVNGALGADLSQPIRWTTAPNAQAYYLYVGTVAGAKDVINTGEIQQTSYLASSIPTNQTLYARMWTKTSGVWQYTDSTFTAAVLVSTFTYPGAGATSLDVTRSWTWTSVPNAQAYYLYVGSTVGEKDLINTGEIQQTSYLPANLPIGRVLYARLWAKVGVWRYTDATFTVSSLTPTLTSPANGTLNANPLQPIQWTSVPGAQAYYLYVGTALGGKNVVNSGEMQQTSYLPGSLPANQTLYARIWARVGGTWRYSDSVFSAASLAPTVTYPPNGAVNADLSQPIQWTTVSDAQAYYLYVGTTPGGQDVVNTGEVIQTSYFVTRPLFGQTLYVRVWALIGGHWRYNDSTFTAAPILAEFVYPLDGATGVDFTQPLRWTSAASGQAYRLEIGTSPGANDLFDGAEISGTSNVVSGLPSSGTLYARIWTKANNQWINHSDIAFTAATTVSASMMLSPTDGTTSFDTGQPFRWSDAPLARGYRLMIGTASGLGDLHDSGEIHVTRRFVPNLPQGVPLFGRLVTKIDGQWLTADFSFSVGVTRVSVAEEIDSALWATDVVRTMAGSDNRPFGWTQLFAAVTPRYNALCTDYASVLLQALSEINIQTPARRLDVAFNTNGFDEHTLTELFNPDTQTWMILDPTFSMAAQRRDGLWATAEDISSSMRTLDWGAITYVFLGATGDAYATAYYLDYPLMYANIFHQGQLHVLGQGTSPLPYLQEFALPVAEIGRQVYSVQCIGGSSAEVVVDGTPTTLSCSGIDSLSPAFYASSVNAPSESTPAFRLYLEQRFVF